MFVLMVSRKFSAKYHHWCYGPYETVEAALEAAKQSDLQDYILLPVISKDYLTRSLG